MPKAKRQEKQSALEKIWGFKKGDLNGCTDNYINYWNYVEFQSE